MRRELQGLIAVMTVVLLSCGDASGKAEPQPTSGSTSTVATTTPSTSQSTTVPSTTTPACSATGLSTGVNALPGLPAAVAMMRADLARAAATCDWHALTLLVDRNGPGVSYSFGAPGDPIAFWRGLESSGQPSGPLRALRLLLGLSFGTQELTSGVQYVWPAAHAANPPSPAQLQEIADTGLYRLAVLQEWVRTGNNYLGYRLAITGTGDWTFLIAGD